MFKNFKKKYFKKRITRKGYKAKRIKSKRIFEKKLNSVAEKKMNLLQFGVRDMIPTSQSGTYAQGVLYATFPNAGTGANQKIGTKIFIRYIRLQVLWQCVTGHSVDGMIAFVLLKEKTPGAISNKLPIQNVYPNNVPIFNDALYKEYVSKKRIKYIKVQSNATVSSSGVFTSDTPYQGRFDIKIKIMKYAVRQNLQLNIPDYFPQFFWFASGTWTNLHNATAQWDVNCTLTYTDV